MDKNEEFHWAEGIKYASEAIKTLFLLNGAATVSILTFIGNAGVGDNKLVYATFCFALGAFMGPVAYTVAYLTQLQYGNNRYGAAGKFHQKTYLVIAFGCLLFLAGIIFAGLGLIRC